MRALHVALTMDCERIKAESPPGGPESWELSERAIRGFCERLLRRGYTPTLFLVPECAEQHAGLLGRLGERGAELGLHVHPQSLGDHRYQGYLGEYSAEMQREIVGQAAERLERILGQRPTSFRAGNFSGNDDTYGVLYDLGFRQGSQSDPGRYAPNFAADWVGALPDPHHVDRADKLIAGEMPFLEVPLTTDPTRLQPSGFPYEIRLESGSFLEWHRPIIESTLQRLSAGGSDFPTLCAFTHNCFAYDDDQDSRAQTLEDLLRYLREREAQGEEVIPVTMQEAHRRYPVGR